jgi:tRNA(Ile)-lysidine synthase
MEQTLAQAFLEALSALPGVNREQDRFLLALSGGLDSVVLLDLCHQSRLSVGVAHCNFQLRGDASDGDEAFADSLSRRYQIPFYSIRFDTLAQARQTGKSIQETARDLRYEWLERIRREQDYDWILTAHHRQDSIETLFINLSRGTGLSGLTGIPAINGRVLRPLLGFGKGDLETYYRKRHLAHREDDSNAERKYQRNKIRHDILPVFRNINPAFDAAVGRTIDHLQQTQQLVQWALEYWREELVSSGDEEVVTVDLQPVMKKGFAPTLLFEFLRPYGVSRPVACDIWQALQAEHTGKWFQTETSEVLIDRSVLKIRKRGGADHHPFTLSQPGTLHLPEGMLVISGPKQRPANIRSDSMVALMDSRQLTFPLYLRRWKAGDRFQPFGMDGHTKKLKDYFVDEKWSRYQKENAWLLVDATDRICWLVGHRLDHRFRLTEATESIIECIYLSNSPIN